MRNISHYKGEVFVDHKLVANIKSDLPHLVFYIDAFELDTIDKEMFAYFLWRLCLELKIDIPENLTFDNVCVSMILEDDDGDETVIINYPRTNIKYLEFVFNLLWNYTYPVSAHS